MYLPIAEFLEIAQLPCRVQGTSTICRSIAGKERLIDTYFYAPVPEQLPSASHRDTTAFSKEH